MIVLARQPRWPVRRSRDDGPNPSARARTFIDRGLEFASGIGSCTASMRQTERALSKLEDGTYGYCEDTGEPIDLKRLMAQPTTSLSLAAQQAREGRTR